MRAHGVIEAEIAGQPHSRVGSIRVGPQIDLLVLDAAPFCAAPQNGGYVPRAVTWPAVLYAVDLPSMLEP
jgi:hypothetical protein